MRKNVSKNGLEKHQRTNTCIKNSNAEGFLKDFLSDFNKFVDKKSNDQNMANRRKDQLANLFNL